MDQICKVSLALILSFIVIACSGKNQNEEKADIDKPVAEAASPKFKVEVRGLKSPVTVSLDGKYIEVTENGLQVLDDALVLDMEYYLYITKQPKDQYCSVQNRAGNVTGDIISRINCSSQKISQLVIPDASLKQCVSEYAANKRWMYTTEMFSLKCNGKNISSTEGIEQLTELTSLNLKDNQLQTADMNSNTILQSLDLANNKLTSVHISKLPELEVLGLVNNNLSEVTFGDQKKMKNIELRDNQISQLSNFDQVSSVAWLDLRNNQMTELSLNEQQIQSVVRIDLTDNPLSASSRAELSRIKDEHGIELQL